MRSDRYPGRMTVRDTLTALQVLPRDAAYPTGGLDPSAAGDFSKRLGSVSRDDLVALVSAVPTSWQVSDGELEALGYFLERRAHAVAARLGALTGGAP